MTDIHDKRRQMIEIDRFERDLLSELTSAMAEERSPEAVMDRVIPMIDTYVDARSETARRYAALAMTSVAGLKEERRQGLI